MTPAITTCTFFRRVALVWSAVRLTVDPAWNLNQRHRTQSTISSELVITCIASHKCVPPPSVRYKYFTRFAVSQKQPCSQYFDCYVRLEAVKTWELGYTHIFPCLVLHRQNGPIIGAIDWHSYSQLILRPWGWLQLTVVPVTSTVVATQHHQ